MHYISIKTLDLDKYKVTEAELVGGSRPRISLLDKKTHQKYILKSYSHNTREVFAECLASFLGEIFKISIQKVSIKRLPSSLEKIFRDTCPNLPKDWIPIGSLVRNVFHKGWTFNYGARIIETPTASMSLEDIENFFRSNYYAPDDLLDGFAVMIVFDAIIGNMDRHHENWGIIESKIFKQQVLFNKRQIKEERKFTSLYDHGSSLLFELSEYDVLEYLKDFKRFENKYIFSSKYSFIRDSNDCDANVFDIIENHIKSKTNWEKRFRKAIRSIIPNASILEIAKKIAQMPNIKDIDYSNKRKELLLKSIISRIQRLENCMVA